MRFRFQDKVPVDAEALDRMAHHIHEQAKQAVIQSAERVRAVEQDEPEGNPYMAQLTEELLEDYTRLPDYLEALFRHSMARRTSQPEEEPEVIEGQATPVKGDGNPPGLPEPGVDEGV